MIDAANKGLFVAGEAADGSRALDRIDDLDPEVVVLDERMPGLTGVETARKMLERRPGQLIIHVLGLPRRRSHREGGEPPASRCA